MLLREGWCNSQYFSWVAIMKAIPGWPRIGAHWAQALVQLWLKQMDNFLRQIWNVMLRDFVVFATNICSIHYSIYLYIYITYLICICITCIVFVNKHDQKGLCSRMRCIHHAVEASLGLHEETLKVQLLFQNGSLFASIHTEAESWRQ